METLDNPCHYWSCIPRAVINYQGIIMLLTCNVVIVVGYTLILTCKCRRSVDEGITAEGDVEQAQEAEEETQEPSGIENANAVDFNEFEEIDEEI